MYVLNSTIIKRFPFARYADPKSIQRGHQYHQQGRVFKIKISADGRKAICSVEGHLDTYTVVIEVEPHSGDLYFDCDCPYAEEHFCKHMVAAAMALSERLEENAVENDVEEKTAQKPSLSPPPVLPRSTWQNHLETALNSLRPARKRTTSKSYVALLTLEKEAFYYAPSPFHFSLFIIRAERWPALRALEEYNEKHDPQVIAEFLNQNREWIHYGEQTYAPPEPEGCLNLPPAAINLLLTLHRHTLLGGSSPYPSNLAILSQLQVPIFQVNRYKKVVLERLRVLSQTVEVMVEFTRQGGHLVLLPHIPDLPLPTKDTKIEILSTSPLWLLLKDTILTPKDPSSVPFLTALPISVPESQADFFRENYLRRIAEVLPLHSDLVQWREVQAEAIPRLYLHDDAQHALAAELRFGYGEWEVPASKGDEALSVEVVPDSWDLIRIHRQRQREEYFYQLLADPIYRLKRAGAGHPYGTFHLRARAHPFDFLMHSIPALTQAGFEIYGEENLKIGKINRATPTLRVHITSGIDWFDLQALVQYGDQQIPLHEVRKALRRGERYIKLADGSVGQIPEDWLEKFKHLWNMTETTEEGFRVRDVHLPLLDSLLEAAGLEAPADLRERRERLRSFEKIEPHPLPRGFRGELRPYQKHGLDWLHFLHQYRFGGILADDMGLGKTIQVLAYLQSLKESRSNEAPHRAALLVVPKSLLTNWQREAERFAPELRFLEYSGNFRKKDVSVFDAYDVIITTYGVMLRDIELLRQYPFEHVILDESQAIKNPLAKSAKAVRLLQAEHRLVLTGTPVENTTFDLWSQFAFLNPGLLGSMEYFRSEFANPIESRSDERAATLLRQLTYPFILRRTKEQVAPELPPRTERLIYTEMAAAQKKIYVRVRERYRAELLGLLETSGMEDARMKILEGLLRLRQIAIHPALVEPAYRGEAPKFEVLLETLDTLQAEGHKALIYSQFVETLKLVRRELDERRIRYAYLDGQTRNRQAAVDQFQNDPTLPFFLISLKAGGVGLNLTAADYVIHLDPWWNPAVEMQASDRTHRIGQDKPVFIYKLITRDSVEEKILQLQERKRSLVKNIVASEASFFKSLTKEDVQVLFS